jgi:hypothetical protein
MLNKRLLLVVILIFSGLLFFAGSGRYFYTPTRLIFEGDVWPPYIIDVNGNKRGF